MRATFTGTSRLASLVPLSILMLGAETANFQSSAQMVLVPVAVTDHRRDVR